ncbi:hypothetical protein [Plantactinospora sp. WMMB782]|uniref:hypothetical protein n=1 Tax=Plantactinospora sp. WMMB782 TaxID=3404121 RepID=UPI003B958F25
MTTGSSEGSLLATGSTTTIGNVEITLDETPGDEDWYVTIPADPADKDIADLRQAYELLESKWQLQPIDPEYCEAEELPDGRMRIYLERI